MKFFFIYLWLYVIQYNSFYNMTTNEQLKLKKINDGIETYLIIVNDTYNLKNKSYEKGQCVKVINHFIVGNSSQKDVDDILTTTKINRITGKLIIGKLSEFIGMIPINSDKFIGSDKIIG